MAALTRLFENPFSDPLITDRRICDYTFDHLNRLKASNTGGRWDGLIKSIIEPADALQAEVDSVDLALGKQKGKTSYLNEVTMSFKKTMSKKKNEMSDLLGGTTSGAFMSFYPTGTTEYTRATRVELPTLVKRVDSLATENADKLGKPLTELLSSFYKNWLASRNDQQVQKGTVSDTRADRSDARKTVETALFVSLYTIVAGYPDNADQCSVFFDFNRLYPTSHRKKAGLLSGGIESAGTVSVQNKSMTAATKFRVSNTCDNAAFFIFSGATEDAVMNIKGVEVKAGKTVTVTAPELGSLDYTFLLIKNLSEVNKVSYVIETKAV